ncbi:hypothetical protein ACHAXA_004366 [Cyclostephanos tholiformis]|uniref:Uncharacterized protein n=1 Tax=Cyclostephanos tholiformis TaxID=382380 RepID=A0ABD3R980_9STRA
MTLLKRTLDDESFSFGTSSDLSTVTPSPSSSTFGDDPDHQDDDVGHNTKKKLKLVHRKEEEERAVLPARCPRQPSPTDVRTDPLAMTTSTSGWAEEVPPMPTAYRSSRIVTLPPNLRGILDAAAVLRSSRSSRSSSPPAFSENDCSPPSLLSFPTESVYMLACCVKTASLRSLRRLQPRRANSQASLGSSCSSGGEGSTQQEDSGVHWEGGGCHHHHHHSSGGFVHPPNAALDWMMKCYEGVHPTTAESSSVVVGGGAASPPLLFVLDGHHALSFCHFTKPKTFAIRPPPPSLPCPNDAVDNSPGSPTLLGTSYAPVPASPRTTRTSARSADEDDPTTPTHPLRDQLAPASTPVVTPNTNRRLSAASFSESREAFLRLASKFWPGPVVIHVRVRTLGGEENVDVPNLSQENTSGGEEAPSWSSSSSSSSMIVSFPKVPKSIGDVVAEAGLSVLPKSVLLSASRLLTGRDANYHDNNDGDQQERRERYFVGMQCPSHPLSRKILNEAYRGGGHPRPKVSHSESSESLASLASSMGNNIRARTVSVAVVGRAVPATPSADGNAAAPGATTAEEVDRSMSSAVFDHKSGGRIVIVDGEDNRECFSVPTCQYGELHPVSLLVDGDNRTIHLIRRGDASVTRNDMADGINDGTILNETSVRRALLKPASFHSLDAIIEKKGDVTGTINRVITAALSNWKIQESIIRA